MELSSPSELFLERLRRDLRPDFEVKHRLGRGGMGEVYEASEPPLNRSVAIKVIHQELAGAAAVDRFRDESQVLAGLRHPNLVTVHRAGTSASGIPYYVMEHLAGETLAQRLARGERLTYRETLALGVQLLGALAVVHRHGLVHRDIKPSNIMLTDDGPILIDFGIVKNLGVDGTSHTGEGRPPGTTLYMPPEQAAGLPVTPRTDLYALGMVLYEAVTGVRWPVEQLPRVRWRSVPIKLQRGLRRALKSDPMDRWADADAFARALDHPWPAWAIAGGAGTSIGAAALLLWQILQPPRPDAAVFPLATGPGLERSFGTSFARQTAIDLRYLPRVVLANPIKSFGCYETLGDSMDAGARRRRCAGRAKHVVEGTVSARRDSLEVKLFIYDDQDHLRDTVLQDDTARATQLASRAAEVVVRAVDPRLDALMRQAGASAPTDLQAWQEFLSGDDAFQQDDWLQADLHYTNALRSDSTFLLAALRLAVIRRWSSQPVGFDLAGLFARNGRSLPKEPSQLIEAELAPFGPRRLALFDSASHEAPWDGFTQLLYANELWGRGPLAGIPLDSAARVFRRTAKLMLGHVPSYDHLVWLFIRLGEQDSARAALDTLRRLANPAVMPIDIPAVFGIIYLGRFQPENDSIAVAGKNPRVLPDIAKALRLGLAFDVPETQLEFGRILADTPGATRPDAEEAQALALIDLGRGQAALREFDAAARGYGSPESELERVEWRVLPRAMGYPVVTDADARQGETELAQWSRSGPLESRALWDLAWAALGRGDRAAATRWQNELLHVAAKDTTASSLLAMLDAARAAERGDPGEALRLSEPLRTTSEDQRVRYPFARAALHIARAGWYERLAKPDSAEHEWLWYENNDATGWPTGPAEAGDVDWALATYARVQRAACALAEGDRARAARYLARVAELWRGADSSVAELLTRAERQPSGCR